MDNKKDTKLVFVVEDEPDIRELIALHLKKAGHQVEKFSGSPTMFARLKETLPDLILLDLMLPDQDGLDVCRTLKANKNYRGIPIIMVTARGDEVDVVLGLELGADDYIVKPFSPREMIARVKAVLRRTIRPDADDSDQVIRFGDLLVIDPQKYDVRVEGRQVNLTSTEFLILKMLARKPGWVFSREKILDTLWGDRKDVFDRTVDVHIKNLRDKLGTAGKLVKNTRGVGYKLEP